MSQDVQGLMDELTSGKKFSLQCCQQIREQMLTKYCDDINHKYYNLFFHEIQPTIRIAEYFNHERTEVSFYGKKYQCDSIIHFGKREKLIEITTAINPNDAKHRSAIAFVHGSEPIMTPDEKNWEVATRDRKNWEDCNLYKNTDSYTNWEKLCSEIYVPLLKSALGKKICKSRSSENYPSWLGIVFDHPLCSSQEKKDEQKRRFDPMCRAGLEMGIEPFRRVFILGRTGSYLFDSFYDKSAIIAPTIEV